MSTGRLDGLSEVEQWFLAHGYRLEFQLTNRAGWSAAVMRGERVAGEKPLLVTDGPNPLDAAIEARAAFARAAGDEL